MNPSSNIRRKDVSMLILQLIMHTKVLTKTFILDKFYNKENLRHDWSF